MTPANHTPSKKNKPNFNSTEDSDQKASSIVVTPTFANATLSPAVHTLPDSHSQVMWLRGCIQTASTGPNPLLPAVTPGTPIPTFPQAFSLP